MPVIVKCFHCSMAQPTSRSQVVHRTNNGHRQNKSVTFYLVQILFRKQNKRCQVTLSGSFLEKKQEMKILWLQEAVEEMSVSLECKDSLLLHVHRSAAPDSSMAQWTRAERDSALDLYNSHTLFCLFFFFFVCLSMIIEALNLTFEKKNMHSSYL